MEDFEGFAMAYFAVDAGMGEFVFDVNDLAVVGGVEQQFHGGCFCLLSGENDGHLAETLGTDEVEGF